MGLTYRVYVGLHLSLALYLDRGVIFYFDLLKKKITNKPKKNFFLIWTQEKVPNKMARYVNSRAPLTMLHLDPRRTAPGSLRNQVVYVLFYLCDE
jgi:hypothetical protein